MFELIDEALSPYFGKIADPMRRRGYGRRKFSTLSEKSRMRGRKFVSRTPPCSTSRPSLAEGGFLLAL
jgi:hypothetical protein